jgi:DNA-binding PadR family transcriptional regulator
MSHIDLIILGLLKRESMSAYDMNKYLEHVYEQRWLKISAPAVYKNLKKLHEKNMVASVHIKEGEMPEKTVYSLTPEGNQYFLDIMYSFAAFEEGHFVEHNAFLANIDKVPFEDGLNMLHTMQTSFRKKLEHVTSISQRDDCMELGIAALLGQYRVVLSALVGWSTEFVKTYQQAYNTQVNKNEVIT